MAICKSQDCKSITTQPIQKTTLISTEELLVLGLVNNHLFLSSTTKRSLQCFKSNQYSLRRCALIRQETRTALARALKKLMSPNLASFHTCGHPKTSLPRTLPVPTGESQPLSNQKTTKSGHFGAPQTANPL